jgi:5-methylcytosine-specific restriction protein B
MSLIKNLYIHLVKNRHAELNDWYSRYKVVFAEVETVRKGLTAGKDIKDKATYVGTRFETENDSWTAFAKHLIVKQSNGVSSRGQSVLSFDNLDRFILDQNFVNALSNLIEKPIRDNVIKFEAAWEKTRQTYGANRTPLLINRIVAACTLDVSTTVDNSAFEWVYGWMIAEGILHQHEDGDASWYDKNVQLMQKLNDLFQDELSKSETDKYLLSIFVWELFEYILNPFTLKKQVIRYGAPGTGKTFAAKQNAALLFDIWAAKHDRFQPRPSYDECVQTVQFHPSYGYEDFIEGLRPVLVNDGQPQLKLQNGVFKEFCKRAGRWEIQVYGIPGAGPDLARGWPELTVGELKPHIHEHLKKYPSWHSIDAMDPSEKIVNVIPPFFFIVDEINRAELSRVLGELMFCIEYRGVQGRVSTQYAGLNTSETAMLRTSVGFKFFVPHNVYIIGTMNTIDRSVESFDLALRRRFRWERVDPDLEILRYNLKQRDAKQGNASRPWVGLADDLLSLNNRISQIEILGRDYQIGHAYLMNLQYPETLTLSEVRRSVWQDSIKPLLEEYLRGSGRVDELIPEFQKAFGM